MATTELKNLQIDREKRRTHEPSPWAVRWIVAGVAVFVLLGAARFIYAKLTAAVDVEIVRVHAAAPIVSGGGNVILNATGYIVAAHKIELAAKVVGKVSSIGVDKGYKVKAGQVLVRLEDDEYRAHLLESKGNLEMLKARLAEAEHGSRAGEVAKAKADLEQAKADQENARVTLERTRDLVQQKVLSKQALDDAQARYDGAVAKVGSFDRAFELVRLGSRHEQIDALRAQVNQAQGTLDYSQVQLENTVIRAPIDGTILERNVEKGEFVTTGFVGDKGAKGYVVSMANLRELDVELDINQNDFGKLTPTQPGIVTTDAYPDRKYEGVIREISPEANRQKATVQVKVKVVNPDDYLRPEMNASVAFYSTEKTGSHAEAKPIIVVPASVVKDNGVFVVVNGKAVRRTVKVGGTSSQGVQIADGLIGGEDVIANPPADLKDGQRVRPKANMPETVIQTKQLKKEFIRDEFHVVALKDVDIAISRGEFVALMGPSGSGKSTLLHLIAAMDRPSGGEILVLGENLRTLSDRAIAHWRNAHIGFVFQSFNLIPVLSAIENVELPLKLTNLKKKERMEHAETALKLVGLGDRMNHLPRQLSGGQEQRVAIARAIVTDPDLILADEPTGNLDAASAQDVLTLLSRLNKEFGKTIVMVTHDPHAAHFATKARHLEKGELLPEGQVPADWTVSAKA